MVTPKNGKSTVKRSGTRRQGDDYQDIVAIDILVDWLEHSERYLWVKVEADDSGFLDDVTAEQSDGTLLFRQVKFAVHADNQDNRLNWNDLLALPAGNKRRGTSLLQKWSKSIESIAKSGRVIDASLVTNRQAGTDLKVALRSDGSADFDSIEQSIRRQIELQLGGEVKARSFFGIFRFETNHPNLSEYASGVQQRFFRVGGTPHGWSNLLQEVGNWVCYRKRPTSDSHIRIADIKLAALWYQLQELPQRFAIPTDYVLPSLTFHEELRERLTRTSSSSPPIVLVATPGCGKSTYTSKLFEDLYADAVPVVRHHYFLSLTDDHTYERIDFHRAAESLMHDLLQDHAEALGDFAQRNPQPRSADLRSWLKQCGDYYSAKGRSLVVIIDGLDHVWKERRAVDELDKLLTVFLPLPNGITLLVATQPVDDSKLPRALLLAAPRHNWTALPMLGPAAIEEWLKHHVDDLHEVPGIPLDEIALLRIAHVLHRRSGGNPLHLRYTLRAIQEQSLRLDESVIEQLPGCPHAGIVDYYRALWLAIPENSRQVLYLLTTAQFPLRSLDVSLCIDPSQQSSVQILSATDQVKHLLISTAIGLQAFHSSLLSFVSQLPEFDDHARILKHKLSDWLTRHAPEHLKWAHSWCLEADIGNEELLLANVTRSWAVDAINECRPRSLVTRILRRALNCAIGRRQFAVVIRIGLLKAYYDAAAAFNDNVLNSIFLARLSMHSDPDVLNWHLAYVDDLTDDQIAALTEVATATGDGSASLRHLALLNNRIEARDDHQWSRHNWLQNSLPLLAVAAMPGGPPSARVVAYAHRFATEKHSSLILSSYANFLLAFRDFERLKALFDDSTSTSAPDDQCLLSEMERRSVTPQLVLTAMEDGKDCDDLAVRFPEDSYFQIYAYIRNIRGFTPDFIQFPAIDVLAMRDFDVHEHSDQIQTVFVRAFFGFVANHLWNRSDRNIAWLDQIHCSAWPKRFLRHLESVVRRWLVADVRIQRPHLSEFLALLSELERPRFRGNENRAEHQYGIVASKAAMSVTFDVLILLPSSASGPCIEQSDLEAIIASQYFDRDDWLNKYKEKRRRWLSHGALDWLINQTEIRLDSSIGYFSERADELARLAAIAAIHRSREGANRLLERASDNILAHGSHKDLLFDQVLSAIDVYSQSFPAEQGHPKCAIKWVRQLAPPIAAIREFTDGDETRHTPRSLADTMAHVCPILLPTYYQWLAAAESYGDAHYVLRQIVRTADLNNPFCFAVVQTAVDHESLDELAKRSRGGDSLATQVILYSQPVLIELDDDSNDSLESVYHAETDSKSNVTPSISAYPPERFCEYVSALRSASIWARSEPISEWGEYWSSRVGHVAVYETLVKAVDRDELDDVYDLLIVLAKRHRNNNELYRWLVRAHRSRNGWNRLVQGEERVRSYWELVRSIGDDRCEQFIVDTLLGDTEHRGMSVDYWSFERLIKYFALFGRGGIARQLVEECVARSLEYVSPIAFPTPSWVNAEQDAS